MGNICRSPTAEGVTRTLAERAGVEHLFEFDSAGTHGYHIGNPPDPRTVMAAAGRGFDLSGLRARQVNAYDFTRFDLVLAMDYGNLELLREACPEQHQGKLGLFLKYAEDRIEEEVPDPYYGGAEGFQQVLDLIEAGANGLLTSLVKK